MGRDWQLKKTLPITIWLCWAHIGVTVYLVDFNQHDDLEQWVLANLEPPLKNGKLKYYRCRSLKHWHASMAKNTAHMAACLDVDGGLTPSTQGSASVDGGLTPSTDALLVNLDGDNVLTPTWIRKLLDDDGPRLVSSEHTMVHYHNPLDSGTFGRMAYMKSIFAGVRGYDTAFLPMGCQDTDLRNRLAAGGNVAIVKNHWVGFSISNVDGGLTPSTRDRTPAANYKAGSTIIVWSGSGHCHTDPCCNLRAPRQRL